MFRHISTIALLIAFAIQSFQMGGIVVGYYLNPAEYAKKCENKAKPVLKCNGKCQMAKKIVEAQKKDEQTPDRKLVNKHHVIGLQSFFTTVYSPKTIPLSSYNLYLVGQKPAGHVHTIFHPPCLV